MDVRRYAEPYLARRSFACSALPCPPSAPLDLKMEKRPASSPYFLVISSTSSSTARSAVPNRYPDPPGRACASWGQQQWLWCVVVCQCRAAVARMGLQLQ